MIDESIVAKRIRKLRYQRNMTQKELADIVGVTKGYISRIENSTTSPPVGTLIGIAQALGVKINSFFESVDPEIIRTVTRADERPLVGFDGDESLRYEHLSMKFPNRAFETYIISGDTNAGVTKNIMHSGQEFLYVLEGEIVIEIEEEEIFLKPGDSILFDSSYPHRGRANYTGTTKILNVSWSPNRDDKSEGDESP